MSGNADGQRRTTPDTEPQASQATRQARHAKIVVFADVGITMILRTFGRRSCSAVVRHLEKSA
jgi:hypothetical protein